jgi:hypothetical protein
VWKFLRNAKTARKDRSPAEIIAIGEWNTYYKKLLTEDRISYTTNATFTRETTIECNLITVTSEEMETAVKKTEDWQGSWTGKYSSRIVKECPSEAIENDSATIHNVHKQTYYTQRVENSAYYPHIQTR